MSKEKRELQKKNREKAIRKAKMKKFLTVGITALVVLGIVGGITAVILYNNVFLTRPESDFSAGLNPDGTIKDVRALDYVELCDYKNMTVSESELYPDEEEIEEHINSLLGEHQELNTEANAPVKSGDKINLDYIGSIDGEEFQGGNTYGQGTDLVIGSGSYIDGFEDQLIGKKAGQSFDINVTFPADYDSEELAGKDAVFAITINGIYTLPEWNDEFVAENLSDQALTTDAYVKNYRQQCYQEKLSSFVAEYAKTNTVINSYPEDYIKKVMGSIKYNDQKMYDYYKDSYGYDGKFSEYTGMDSKEYEAHLRTQAESRVDNFLMVQGIYEEAGLTVTTEDVNKALEALGIDSSFYKQQEEIYGKGYLYQSAMAYTVQSYLEKNVQITK